MRRAAHWTVLVWFVCVSCEAVLSIYHFQRSADAPLAVVHYAAQAYRRWRPPRAVTQSPVGIWRDDPKLGYVHIPSAVGVHRRDFFEVTYTIGSEGERVTQPPIISRGEVLFLGCSYTFGWGVEDHEAYPSVLATEHWRDVHVVNKAVSGYGTSHAYLQLRDVLAAQPPPTVVIYPMIPDHVCRNYLRPSWVEQLAASGRRHPHFEVVDTRPEFRGVVERGSAALDEKALQEREVDVTAALLADMQRHATEANVAFFVVLLPQKFDSACSPTDWPPGIIESLVRHRIRHVDLTGLKNEVTWLKGDPHPDAKGHRVLARAMAGSIVGAGVSELRASAQP